LRVITATAKPVTAPMIIMPSTPRFSTPAFSTTSSPMAASRIGVAATISAASSTTGLIDETSIRRPPAAEADAVVGEHVEGEEEEQEHPLEHLDRRRRQAEHELRQLAADVGERHQKPGQQDADRVQPAEEGHDDRGEAVARR
jgi:hypothetical protein